MNAIKDFFQRYQRAEIQTRSATLAYHTLLALVPVVGLIFWYFKGMGLSQYWFNLIRSYLLSQVAVTANASLIKSFDRITTPNAAHSWGWAGLAIVFYTAWNLIHKFGQSVDKILMTAPDHEHIHKRGFVILHLRRLLVMLVLPLGIVASVSVAQWIRKDSWLSYLFGLKAVGHYFTFPLFWGIHILVFFMIYYFIPQIHVSRRQALKAALIAGPLSEIIKHLIGVYSQYMILMHKIYGIFIAVPLFILWIQIAWMIALCGALFIRFSPRRRVAAASL